MLALEFNSHSERIVYCLAYHNRSWVSLSARQNAQRAGSPDVFYRDEVPPACQNRFCKAGREDCFS